MEKKSKRKSLSLTLRNYFIAGVVVLIPIGFTLYLSKILIGVSSNLIPKNLNPNHYLPFDIPGVEILISILLNSFSSREIVKNIQVGESFTLKNEKIIFKKIAIEKEKNYFKAAEQRLKTTKPIEDDLLDTLKNNRSKPRIPFGSLVELGIIKPGTNIFDNKKKITARIMADGSIKHNQAEGSIHKVAATILGAESCNGWTFWHCDINGRTYPIDYLRQRLISKH